MLLLISSLYVYSTLSYPSLTYSPTLNGHPNLWHATKTSTCTASDVEKKMRYLLTHTPAPLLSLSSPPSLSSQNTKTKYN
ncbi:hypothetical protein BKA65DRAFT_237314 [Rhexocercosporidium sp. MPI-PUGE-AT-0058]|nr:hypothetical protein BKA65DRAFT_237314 [Rhexocercosporidium sp. MPI-PUGE-AT-0058]